VAKRLSHQPLGGLSAIVIHQLVCGNGLEIMEANEELFKDVFAQFGEAYYHSESLHRELCNYYVMATFENTEDITLPRIEEKYAFAFSQTLGQIIEKTKGLFPEELKQRLEKALIKRNYLAHHYWYDRCPLMFSEQGLLELRQELQIFTLLFINLDAAIVTYFKPKLEEMGVTDKLIQEAFEKLRNGEPDIPLASQRSINKHERIVRVWDVQMGDNLASQIFETEDGCLWQLCDVGLGWTYYKKPSPDWTINERFQKYLPVNITPRPTITSPWNYEISLGKGIIFWVKRGKREKSYTWGIKAHSK